MSAKIETVGQLRQFLANMMMGVKSGDIKVQEASQMQKLAAQINESFYAEIKVAQIRRGLGEESKLLPTGDLPLSK